MTPETNPTLFREEGPMDEYTKESMWRSFWPEEALVDGYCREDYEDDHEREPGHRDRVVDAIGEYLANGKRRRR